MKILISGGHLTPALAFIDFIQLNHPEDQIIFVGRKFTQNTLQQKSVEQAEIEKRKVQFIEFDSGKFTLANPLIGIGQLAKLIKGLLRANQILSEQKPAVFLSFGGYLAVPLAMSSAMRSVPIITHEQTMAPGFANLLIAKFANKVAVSFLETKKYFSSQKVSLTGNPIRQQLWQSKPPQPSWAMKTSQRPLLYITGGSQGSHAINLVIEQLLPQLVSEWDIIHQCGKPNSLLHYAQQLEKTKRELPKELQSRYVVREWVDETELAWIYQQAWAMIARSGANTVQEVILAKIPTLFIPLAHARQDEQTKNAQVLVQKNAGLLLAQRDLDGPHLLKSLNQLKVQHQQLVKNLSTMTHFSPDQPSQLLYELIKTVTHIN